MAEVLQAKTDWKLVFWKGVGTYPPNFHVEGKSPPIIYMYFPFNGVSLTQNFR